MPAQLLSEFASHDDLEIVTSHKGGQDRIVFGECRDDVLSARVVTDSGPIYTGVMSVSSWEHFARHPVLREGLVLPPGPWADEAYRLRQYLLAQVAESLEPDAFVTDDRFLLDFRRPDFIGMNFLSSMDAIALIGSHLRNRGHFTIKRNFLGDQPSFPPMGRPLFYWVLCREMLPNGWRWFSGIVASDEATGGELTGLGHSMFTRVSQALRARDYAHWHLLQREENAGTDEALLYLDMMLLSLTASFDVVARIIDVALGLRTPSQQITWNNDRWRQVLRKADASFDSIMTPSASHGQTHRLLSILRNSIHGKALTTLALERGENRLTRMLVLPNADRSELRHLLTCLGGLESWGYEEIAHAFTCVKAGMVSEQLMPLVTAALNDLMRLTPVERLPGLTPNTELMTSPPLNDRWFGTEARHRVRLLAGIWTCAG